MKDNQTSLRCLSGNIIKQGDVSSVFRYKCTTDDKKPLNGQAIVQLIHSEKGMIEFEVEMKNGIIEFQLEKALPVGVYTVEVECGGYVFPSTSTQTITVNENLGGYVSDKAIELYGLKEIVKQYIAEEKEENIPDLLLFYNLGKV